MKAFAVGLVFLMAVSILAGVGILHPPLKATDIILPSFKKAGMFIMKMLDRTQSVEYSL